MKAGFSYRSRFTLLFALAVFAMSFIPAQYYHRTLSEKTTREAQEQVVREMEFIHQMLTREMHFNSTQELHQWFELIGKSLNFRITYIADGGTVIADSHVPFEAIRSLDNHASRPEIMEAREKDMGTAIRYSGSTQEKQLYVARAIGTHGAIPSGIIRVSTSFDEAKELNSHIKSAFMVIVGAVVSATVFVAFFMFHQLKKTIGQMIQAIKTIGEGNYKKRVVLNNVHEFYPMAEAINEMARHFNEHVNEISQQKQQLQAVFDGMQEGVMVLDSNGRIQSLNQAMWKVISNPSQSIGRRPLEAVMSIELQDACDRIMAGDTNLGRRPLTLQLELEPEKYYEVNVVKMDKSSKNLGAILVFHNISELKRLEKVRQDFVANVTHELRTPLTSIKGYTETLIAEHGQKHEMLESFLQVILKNTNHMVKMVDDLLQLARIESKKISARAIPVNAWEALEPAWNECTTLAQSRSMTLKNLLPQKGVQVLSDPDQLTQVFRNLLENAIKYGSEGSDLTVFVQDEGKSFSFGVQDQGLGIAPEHQQRVFERFYRIERHRGSKSGSTGLGLAICKHIIQGYGGRIWVQSPNADGTSGSTFFFSLPKTSTTNTEPSDKNDSAGENKTSPKKLEAI